MDTHGPEIKVANMLGVNICAVGRLRQSPEAFLVSNYISRFNKLGRQVGLGPASIVEVEDKTNSGISAEAALLENCLLYTSDAADE